MQKKTLLLVSGILSLTLTVCPASALTAEPHPDLTDYTELAYTQGWINTVPTYIQDFIEDSGYSVCVSPYPAANGGMGGAPIYGSCCKETGEIFIYGPGSGFSVVHEMGHAFDFATGGCSYGADFNYLYYYEGKALRDCTNVTVNNPQEFYAELFATLMENPDTARKLCPMSSAYIESQTEAVRRKYDTRNRNSSSKNGKKGSEKPGIVFVN